MSTKVIDSPPEPKIRENLGKFFYDIAKLTFTHTAKSISHPSINILFHAVISRY